MIKQLRIISNFTKNIVKPSSFRAYSTNNDKNRTHLKEWQQFWDESKTPFWQQDDINPSLVNNAHLLLPNQNSRIFVPLCGKSLDMKW